MLNWTQSNSPKISSNRLRISAMKRKDGEEMVPKGVWPVPFLAFLKGAKDVIWGVISPQKGRPTQG